MMSRMCVADQANNKLSSVPETDFNNHLNRFSLFSLSELLEIVQLDKFSAMCILF